MSLRPHPCQPALAELNTPAVAVTARILERGRAAGVFRRDVEAIDVLATPSRAS